MGEEEGIEEGGRKIEEIREGSKWWVEREGIEVGEEVVRVYKEGLKWYVRGEYEGWGERFGEVCFEEFG